MKRRSPLTPASHRHTGHRKAQKGPAPRFKPVILPEPVTIERLSHDGRGIAHWQGKTMFVVGGLPGERVDVRLVAEQTRFTEAQVIAWQTQSPERQAPPCEHYDQCGGCQLQHLAPAAQLVQKQNTVLDQLARWASLEPQYLATPITSPSEGYRHRARLGVRTDRGGTVTLGFRRRRQNQLVDIEHCAVLAEPLNALLPPLREWLSALSPRDAVSHVELLLAEEGPALVIRQVKTLARTDRWGLANRLPTVAPEHIWFQPPKDELLVGVEGQEVDPRLSYQLPDFDVTLAFHPRDFTQVNATVNQRMVAQAVQWLAPQPGERVLDLFCGMGNFTLPLARSGARLVGLEGSATMVERGRQNARRNGLDVVFETANLADAGRTPGTLWRGGFRGGSSAPGPDAVLLDPPRDGAREILAPLAQLKPERLVYVSCNPATLARDAGELAVAGYDLQSLGVLDMFPHTEHVESMALFRRR
ncbi:23S rRNA (uracil(1939)-C(5))-methyltransferase RlmD [Marinimicrobium sp. ARAG 43.8]|uniref:23S rRNA (uracil(1939)-C(5))-methyltransferase RlmD n=1 Tax=Marinimicrobium sp. ARAG 43.8 TaxID=3418719 RepID=UPI003CF1555A